jgi:pimeloyl-ACP methyl ester carboxylesterase
MTISPVRATERRTQLGAGITMHHVDQGDPDGEPLVLVHGYSDSSHSFSQLLPLLDPGYRVHAIDLRGHGGSDRPADGYGIDSLAADVVSFLDAVGIARADLVGHSLGTLVARRVAETRPDRVDRLVLIGAARAPVNDDVRGLRAEVMELDETTLSEFAREFQLSTVHTGMPDGFLDRVVEVSRSMPLHAWQGVIEGLAVFDDDADLARIAAPTLLLWGQHDAYFGRDEQEWLARSIPRARLHIYPDSGHNPHWEIPDIVARDIQAFLADR